MHLLINDTLLYERKPQKKEEEDQHSAGIEPTTSKTTDLDIFWKPEIVERRLGVEARRVRLDQDLADADVFADLGQRRLHRLAGSKDRHLQQKD